MVFLTSSWLYFSSGVMLAEIHCFSLLIFLFFRISAISADPGKVLFCLYNWARCRSWARMETALPNEHRLWLILIKSEFYFYLCSGHWKSVLLCLAFCHPQDLYFYVEAFLIDNEFQNLYILHVFIHVVLTIFKGLIFHVMYFRFL